MPTTSKPTDCSQHPVHTDVEYDLTGTLSQSPTTWPTWKDTLTHQVILAEYEQATHQK